MDDERLNQIFVEAGENYDLKTITARFMAFKDLKIRWVRCIRRIEFMVTDYLKEAPEDAVKDLAETMFAKIYEDPDTMYSDRFSDWLVSDQFVELNRESYLQRCNVLSKDFRSMFHNLQGTYENLKERGLVRDIPNLSLRWTDDRGVEPMGFSSALMRSVIIPTYMDCKDVPDDVFEYNLFRLLINVEADFKENPMDRKRHCEHRIETYPDAGGYRTSSTGTTATPSAG